MFPINGSSLPLGMLSERPGVLEVIAYQLNGLIVVFLALTLIWCCMEIVGLYYKRIAAKEAAAKKARIVAEEAAAAEASVQTDKDISLPPELIAAIAAAVKVALRDKRHKIHAIVPNATDWAREGRRQIFSSHSIR